MGKSVYGITELCYFGIRLVDCGIKNYCCCHFQLESLAKTIEFIKYFNKVSFNIAELLKYVFLSEAKNLYKWL